MLLLIGIILKSPSYLTKWTLFQVCLALLGSSISSILKLLTYGDDYDNLDRALNQPICIAQQKLSVFFFYPLYLLPSVLTFHLWFGLIKMNSNIEKAHFWTLTMSIWGFACIYTTIVVIVSGLNENWGVMVTRFVCEAYDFSSTWYLYWPVLLIVSLLAFVSLFFAIRSTIILWKIWSAYKLNNQSSEEIQIVILQQSKSHHMKSYIDHSHYISNFTSSLFGGLVFLIFGTTKSSLLSITQYLGYKNKSDDDDTLYVFRPSSYHLESLATTDIKTKRTTRDTIESEAVTIEVLVENDRHPSFLEKQKRTKHYKHSSSRNSNRRRRHSDTRHNGSQRRRRHHHQDTNESKNRKNNDISFGNSRRIMIGNSDEVVSRTTFQIRIVDVVIVMLAVEEDLVV
ncbi:17239_t:CDS:2 [Entrophospora sp. SA101]|nr:14813_t:CDS:2 [Entrophospora sp. SA101]CAJ0846397.1 17239_t:CDS:2 [Entrophospora sp. SA101]